LSVKIKNDLLFDRVEKALQSGGPVTKLDEAGFKMRTISPGQRPGTALFRSVPPSRGAVIISSWPRPTPSFRDMLAARDGRQPGFKSTYEFKKNGQGNAWNKATVSFCFAPGSTKGDGRFAGRGPGGSGGRHAGATSDPTNGRGDCFRRTRQALIFTVSSTTEEGWMTVGNGNADPGRKAMMMATMQPVAVIGPAQRDCHFRIL